MLPAHGPLQGGSRARLVELAGIALAAAVVSFAGIGSHSLWTPDEPRDADVGKTMLVSGDLVEPRYGGRPFLEKPPLTWWMQAAAYRAFGVSDTVARVPSALCAGLTLLATYAFARRLGGRRAGWLAAAALASTAEFTEDMRRAIVDPPMVLMVTLVHFGFAVLITAGDAGTWSAAEQRAARLAIVLAVPLAFLAKGMAGLGLALEPPVVYLLATARRSGGSDHLRGADRRSWPATVRLLAPLALLGVPLFAAMTIPWAVALVREGGWAALRECLVNNTVGRLLPTEAGRVYAHRLPVWYYLPNGAAALLPWSLALPAMLRGGRKDPDRAGGWPGPGEAAGRLLTAWFFLGVALLSLAASKRTVYLVPLLPALAVPLGLWLSRLGRTDRSRWDRPTGLLLLALAAVLPAGLWVGAWEAARGVFHGFPVAPLRASLAANSLAVAGAAAAASSALLLARLVRHLRAGTTPSGPWLVLPFLAIGLIYQTAVKAAIDPLKNLHDLTAAVARIDPGPGPVAVYRPYETMVGIIDFDLGRKVEAIGSPEALASLFATRPQARVVLSLADLRELPESRRQCLRLLYDETATKASPFAIAVSRRE
ncbi:MAG: glycosyltransferase family 39 protein [Acidobacteria bacterium]|nr:glycosyltransferase family 39 protein [Acidobacteriota bacterium]